MKKNNENEIEQKLLSNASIDDLIKIKMEQELKAEFEKQKEIPKKEIVTDISKVPTELIFSKSAVFKVFNRNNKIETFVNGIQAEAMLGIQTATRAKIKRGEMDAFSTETSYVKFEKIEC